MLYMSPAVSFGMHTAASPYDAVPFDQDNIDMHGLAHAHRGLLRTQGTQLV